MYYLKSRIKKFTSNFILLDHFRKVVANCSLRLMFEHVDFILVVSIVRTKILPTARIVCRLG